MPAPVQIARRESAFSPDPSRSPLLHPALSTSLSRSFGLNSPFSLSAMSTSLKDLSSSPGFSSMAMSLGRSFEERPKIEAQFFKNFTCCGLDLHDLHGLLEHFEECHVAFDDDGAGSDGGMDLEGVEPAESEGTISGPPSPRLLAHGVRELKKSGLSSFETPDSPATQALHLDGGMELDMEMGDEVAGEDGSSPSSVGSASSHLTSSSGFPQQPAMSSFENPLPLHGSASKKKQQQQAAAAAAAAAAGQQQPPPPAQPSFAASTGISPASTTIPSLPGVPAVNISGLSSSRPGTPSAVEPPNPIDSTAFLPPMPPSGTVNPAAALGAPPVAPPVGGGFAPLLLFPGGGGAAGQPVASTSSHVHSSSQSPPPPVGMGLGAGLGLGGAGMGMGGDFGVEPEEEEETEEDESDEDDTDDEEEDEQQQRQQAQFLLNQYQAQAPQHGLGTLPFLPPGSLPPVPPPTAPGQRPKHHPNHVPLHQQQQQQKKAAAAAAASSQHSPSPHPIIINPHDPHTIAALANTTLKDPMQTAAAIAALGPNSLAALPTALHPLGQGVQISPSGRPYTPPSEKPFKCTVPGCDKSYKQQNGLKYHRLHGHCGANAVKDGVDPRSEGKPYVCHVASCGKRYKNMNGLRYHYQHSGAHGALGLQMLAQGCHPPPQFPPGHKRTGGGSGGGSSHQLAQSYIPGGSTSSSRASSPHGGYGAVRGMGGVVDAHGLMSAAGRYA